MSGNGQEQRGFLFLAALVVLLSWLLREQFVLFTHVVEPIRGDVRQYFAYAWNLVHHGVFSMADPGSPIVTPDAFRGPGYPLFLAGNLLVGGEPGGWYGLALQLQALLGTATVALSMALGRHWLSHRATLAAGVLMALWPHHIAATGAILSEVLFGFLLVLAMWLIAQAIRRDSQRLAIAAGASFGAAYLVNPIVLLFPPLAALLLLRVGRTRQAIFLALLPLLIAGAWGLRNASLPAIPDEPGRATLNLVEGSWPECFAASNYKNVDPVAAGILRSIHAEEQLVAKDPRKGMAAIAHRMAEAPGYYLTWYIIRKPFLLWAWGIRIGWGDVYFVQVDHSPLDVNPPLRAIKATLRLLNPLIFILSAVAALVLTGRTFRRDFVADHGQLTATLVALFCVYVTLLHTVFQAEPRYSIPYRPFELLLACTALAAIVARSRRLRSPDRSISP